jgi:hypothetical protein
MTYGPCKNVMFVFTLADISQVQFVSFIYLASPVYGTETDNYKRDCPETERVHLYCFKSFA